MPCKRRTSKPPCSCSCCLPGSPCQGQSATTAITSTADQNGYCALVTGVTHELLLLTWWPSGPKDIEQTTKAHICNMHASHIMHAVQLLRLTWWPLGSFKATVQANRCTLRRHACHTHSVTFLLLHVTHTKATCVQASCCCSPGGPWGPSGPVGPTKEVPLAPWGPAGSRK
jgi:hypothetical protein